jgi:hypothetical protein
MTRDFCPPLYPEESYYLPDLPTTMPVMGWIQETIETITDMYQRHETMWVTVISFAFVSGTMWKEGRVGI